MRNLVRSLVLAIALVSALAGVPSAKALADLPAREACVDQSGICTVSGAPCATRGECPITGELCVCQ
jgi:hypothetical protein